MNDWIEQPIIEPDAAVYRQALAHQLQLTKPPGSLGLLEEIAVRLCAMQGTLIPTLDRLAIRIFAGDHGVAAEAVSAFPQAVTVEMIRNFAAGGAAINVLARGLDADFAVVNMGTATTSPMGDNILQYPVAPGTANFCQGPAMSAAQLQQSLAAGAAIAEQLGPVDLFIGGEMGIANSCSAAALAAALLQAPAEALVGLGTGVDGAGRARKVDAVARALARLHSMPDAVTGDPLALLQQLGGFEIAALTACYLRCAQRGIPALIDGFICSVAALLAARINPACRRWFFFAHQSAEAGHGRVLAAMDATALLQLDMRLGEGSGAALAVPLLRSACELHNNMATFATAGVSDGH